jgi:hypothetical protein
MKLLVASLMLVLAMPVSVAQDCTPTSADPASVLVIDLLGRTSYCEERGNPLGVPIPLSGFLFGPDADGDGIPEPFEGQGTWCYEETNGRGGMQRGGIGLLGDWFPPGCDQNPDWQPTDLTIPCLIIGEDDVDHETCGAGPDALIIGLKWVGPFP